MRDRPGESSQERPLGGPLVGLRVVEMAGLAPVPFAATVLADLGADVIRIDRPTSVPGPDGGDGTSGAGDRRTPPPEPLGRSRRSVAVDLKHPSGADVVLDLVERADVFLEGFRPGVCERLGIGPGECLARNPRLVYGRLTGWGQDGPWAQAAGHDITYLALSGALHPIGPGDRPPTPPVNYVADFGGGGMLLVVGVLAALHERSVSGQGQVVDAAMVDGAALMTAMLHGLMAGGVWSDERGTNLLDGSAPFYSTYECADGRYVAVGALEPQFWAALVEGLGAPGLPDPRDRSTWPELRAQLEAIFATRTRDEWAAHFEGTDACVAPVLSLTEAPDHPHNVARGTFTGVAGLRQPAPAPRLSRTPAAEPSPPPYPGQHTREALLAWGLPEGAVAAAVGSGAAR